MLVLQYEEQEKKSVWDQMGWATAHFQFWVATLQVVSRQERHGMHNRRTCAHDRVPERTTKDDRPPS